MVTPESNELFRLFSHYKNNVFLYGNGLYENPDRYIRTMEFIDNAVTTENSRKADYGH